MNKVNKRLNRKTIVLLVLLSLLLLPVLTSTVKYGVFLYQYYKEPERSFSKYCSIRASAWEVRQPYVIFPDLDTVNTAEKQEYLQKTCMSPFFFIERQNLVYLGCSYTEEKYKTEVARLAELCGEANTEVFAFPTYVYYGFYPNGCCEYAFCDESSHTVHYLSFQGSMLLEQYIPNQLQPNTPFYFGKADSAEEWDGGMF